MSVEHGNFVHGQSSKSPTYRSWSHMAERCRMSSRKSRWYAERGISVCERWSGKNGYPNFLEDMGERPQGHTLDRIDNDGEYSPDNCRWADHKTQCRNRSSSKLLTYKGETKTVIEWSETTGIKYSTLLNRVNNCGLTVEQAITLPVKNTGKKFQVNNNRRYL